MSELQHYGIRGMKWGRRRPEGPDGRVQSSSMSPTSEDSARASQYREKAKTHGTSSLSNQELQTVITRDNLLQQYARLNPREQTQGEKIVAGIQTTVSYAQKAHQMYNSPVGKMIRSEISKRKG